MSVLHGRERELFDAFLAKARSNGFSVTAVDSAEEADNLRHLPADQLALVAAELGRYIAATTSQVSRQVVHTYLLRGEEVAVGSAIRFLSQLMPRAVAGHADVLEELCRLRIGDSSLHPIHAHDELRDYVLEAIEQHAASGSPIAPGMRSWLVSAADVWRAQPRSPVRGLARVAALLGPDQPAPPAAEWSGRRAATEAIRRLDSITASANAHGSYTILDQKSSALAAEVLAIPDASSPALLIEVMRRIDLALPENISFRPDAASAVCATLGKLLASLIDEYAGADAVLTEHICRWSLQPRPMSTETEAACDRLLPAIKAHASRGALMPAMRAWLERYYQRPELTRAENRALRREIAALMDKQPPTALNNGEAWSDTAIAEIDAAPNGGLRDAWIALLDHCLSATSASPSGKWLKSVSGDLDRVGAADFAAAVSRWFPLVDKPRTTTVRAPRYYEDRYTEGSHHLLDHHMTILRGLCWIAASLPAADYTPDLARALGRLAISSYKKLPGVGPRAVRVGNAAIQALGQIEGPDALGQLAMLKVKVKFIPAQKGIDKALSAAAAREGLPREEIEELAVPAYGLTGVGVLEEALGDYTARMTVEPSGDTTLVFLQHTTDKKGNPVTKTIKSAPAAVKKDHAEELKEFKAAMKDIAAMVPAQKERIDSLFLEQKSWSYSTWRERYLDHPIVGVIARRLIWTIADRADEPGRAVTWLDSAEGGEGALVDATGALQAFNEAAAIVRLWHPLDSDTESTLAWRRFFEDRELRQPFKQAHREVYILTEAERNTRVYSNRFAAHIIRQHQFHALAAARGWKNKLRLLVDAEYPPATKQLEKWGLRAEFWIEGAGDEWGTDTNEAGAYLRLVTDQVRFYAIAAAQVTAHAGGGGYGVTFVRRDNDQPGPAINEPIALDQIPPLVLSEILRDVDLFVGVSSIGNNPEWTDGGPEARYREYWHHYSFGELSNTAQTRRELLGRLIPRLKIAPVCTLSEKYLRVQGTIRAYNIHLGSGNILMEPNDQYLCIVPSSRDDSVSGIHLPFEGDRVLSIILSKAFMLAADDQIKDSSITGQIRRK